MFTTFYVLLVGVTIVSASPFSFYPPEGPVDALSHYLCETYGTRSDNETNSSSNSSLGGLTAQMNVSCDVCKITVRVLQEIVFSGCTGDSLAEIATIICNLLHVTSEQVCYGLTREFKDEVVYVFEHLTLSPDEVCDILLEETCLVPPNPMEEWSVTFPDVPKPPIQPMFPPKQGSPVTRILHLTDFHVDPMYQEGANTDCDEPLCCREESGTPQNASQAAGKWGDYKCDLPKRTLENLFQYLRDHKDQFDVIYFTGDIPPHNIWNQTQEDQLTSLEYSTKLFKEYLPGVPVYSCVGNHESAPVNSYPPPFITGKNNITWLYSALSESWRIWLADNVTDTILKGAYYTVSPFPGLRIISLNMNYCQNYNGWLLLNMTDPAGQLQWLVSVLQDAENAKEKVHILGHIQSSECMKAFSWNYVDIINRYESTVVGQFFGHKHTDQFAVFYDKDHLPRPSSVLYMPGSVTTNLNLNPGFRIYHVDGYYADSTHHPLRYQNYILNLTDANLSDNPQWIIEYDTLTDLGMKTIYPADWNDLINRMKNNETLFQKYYKYTSKMVDQGPCVGECKTELLCSRKQARAFDTTSTICDDL